jgi:hypothetical protein
MKDANQKITTVAQWYEQTRNKIKALDIKHTDFYVRVTGEMCGTVAVTKGYIAKYTSPFSGKVVYYACKELFNYSQSWQYHVTFCPEMNKAIKANKNHKWVDVQAMTIKTFPSFTKAFNYLELKPKES